MPASELQTFQAQMSAYLLASSGTAPDRPLLSFLHPIETAVSGLHIYKNNVFSRLIEALEDTYPVVQRLVGAEFFRFAAQHYIADHPPRTGRLVHFAEGFSRFLTMFSPALSVPYLPDIARLEYLFLQAYHAPDIPSFSDLPSLPRHELHGLRLGLHPSASLMRSSYQVSRIWELHKRPGEIGEIVLPAQSEHLMVIRPETQVEVRRLSPGTYAMIKALHENATIGAAFEAGSDAERRFKPRRQLMALIHGGTFTDVYRDPSSRGTRL